MAQIDSYIRRVNKECNLTHLEDIYDLYEFIPNEDLRTLFAAFHTQLNYWFSVINSDIRYQFDEDGNKVSQGIFKEFISSRLFHQLAQIHHPDTVAQLRHGTQVMGNEQNRHSKLFIQISNQIQDPLLNGHVQSRGGFIGSQRHGDHDTLLHTAGKLIGLLLVAVFRIG